MSTNKVKKVVETAAEKPEPVVRKARSAAQSAEKKAAAGFMPEYYVQYASRQYDCAILLERCKADFEAKYHTDRIRSCKLYIKPEDNMVYYVINDIEDKLAL